MLWGVVWTSRCWWLKIVSSKSKSIWNATQPSTDWIKITDFTSWLWAVSVHEHFIAVFLYDRKNRITDTESFLSAKIKMFSYFTQMLSAQGISSLHNKSDCHIPLWSKWFIMKFPSVSSTPARKHHPSGCFSVLSKRENTIHLGVFQYLAHDPAAILLLKGSL